MLNRHKGGGFPPFALRFGSGLAVATSRASSFCVHPGPPAPPHDIHCGDGYQEDGYDSLPGHESYSASGEDLRRSSCDLYCRSNHRLPNTRGRGDVQGGKDSSHRLTSLIKTDCPFFWFRHVSLLRVRYLLTRVFWHDMRDRRFCSLTEDSIYSYRCLIAHRPRR